MSLPLVILSVGASLGVGAVSVPAIGTVLSKPMTGEVVPTRITDLAGYLFPSGTARGLDDGVELEDPGVIDVLINGGTSPTVPAPRTGGRATPPPSSPGILAPSAPATASADQKRMLAVASFGGGLVIAFASFILIRRLMGG